MQAGRIACEEIELFPQEAFKALSGGASALYGPSLPLVWVLDISRSTLRKNSIKETACTFSKWSL